MLTTSGIELRPLAFINACIYIVRCYSYSCPKFVFQPNAIGIWLQYLHSFASFITVGGKMGSGRI